MADEDAEGRPQPSVMLVTEPHMRQYAHVAGSPLEGRATVAQVDWSDRVDEAAYVAAFDAALSEADALVVSPWSRVCVPAFTQQRWSTATKLKAIAGTFDNRFGDWLDVAEAAQRGVTVVDTSRSMTPTVAEFALAMTLGVLRDIPAAVQLVREGGWKSRTWDQPGFVHGDLNGRRVGLAGGGGPGGVVAAGRERTDPRRSRRVRPGASLTRCVLQEKPMGRSDAPRGRGYDRLSPAVFHHGLHGCLGSACRQGRAVPGLRS